MSAAITTLIVLATLIFGAVYPWGYVPLFAAAAGLGAAGLVAGGRIPADVRRLAVALLLAVVAILLQLVPMSRATLDGISPNTASLLEQYSLTFAAGEGNHALSINRRATVTALFGLTALSLFIVGAPSLLSRRAFKALPRNIAIFAVPVAVYGIYGREHNNGLVYGFWQPLEGTNAKGFGPFVNRNHFAGWMLMATCLAIGALCGRLEPAFQRVKPGWRSRLIWLASSDANGIVLFAAAIAAMSVSLVWTMSRSGILSFTLAMACFVVLVAGRRNVGSIGRTAGAIGLVTVLAGSVMWRGFDAVVRWFGDTTDVVSRLAAWQDGWQVVRDFPMTGTGINTYGDAMVFYQKQVQGMSMTRAHNDYLQLLAEGGLLVFVPAAVAALLLAAIVARRIDEARQDGPVFWVRAGAAVGLLSVAAQETVEFSLHIPANAFLFATLAALAIAAPNQLARGAPIAPASLEHRRAEQGGRRESESPRRRAHSKE